ncbi:SsgA family sporulation/cell division regulator [Streptomyces sp. BR123]|uniref:SsgA family sporulation/cell division regulator n=1 Tax=Streptomyces sp. BR123 TaxID=2749828 RepID=UPI0034D979EE
MDVSLTGAGQNAVPLRARLSYTAADPLAVRVEFFHRAVRLACWHFDRQTLAEGLHRPTGEGDVFSARPPTARNGWCGWNCTAATRTDLPWPFSLRTHAPSTAS